MITRLLRGGCGYGIGRAYLLPSVVAEEEDLEAKGKRGMEEHQEDRDESDGLLVSLDAT